MKGFDVNPRGESMSAGPPFQFLSKLVREHRCDRIPEANGRENNPRSPESKPELLPKSGRRPGTLAAPSR